MKLAIISLFLVALACALPVEQPASEERSPRQLYPQYYGQQYFYPRGPFRYPNYFFQPSAYFVPNPAIDEQSDVSLRAGELLESRQAISNLLCSPTSPLLNSFVCTTVAPFASGLVPASAFQMCKTTSNLNKATGTVQLLNGYGPRACSFYITIPDNTKTVSVTCSSLSLVDGTVTLWDPVPDVNAEVGPLEKDTPLATSTNKARIDFKSATGTDSFKCSWKAA